MNLVVGDEEEADWLAFHVITAALTAARRGVGISIVAYDRLGTRHATGLRAGHTTVRDALRLARQIIIEPSTRRLLSAADTVALARDARRAQSSQRSSEQGRDGLGELASLELGELAAAAALHPLSSLMRATLRKVLPPATITIVSRWNHDIDALAIAIPAARAGGYRVLVVDATSPGSPPPPSVWQTVLGSRVPDSVMLRSQVATIPA